MITFNSDSINIQNSKGDNSPSLNFNFDSDNFEKIESSLIPFQLYDKSSKRLTDIYFLLHPEELEFTDPQNIARYLNQQQNQNAPLRNNLSDDEILSTINSRYHSSFEDIHQLLQSLDDDEDKLSQLIKKELEKDKSLNTLIERYKSFSNNSNTDKTDKTE